MVTASILEKYSTKRIALPGDYRPTPEAWEFHSSLARFRYLIWGVKSGKSRTGAVETARGIIGSKPNSLSWAIAPTHHNLEEAERELLLILYAIPGMVLGRNQNKREYRLASGRRLQFRSAADPDNLRGPNIDGVAWFDECAFGKAQAHIILRERVMATGAPIIYTTTPHGRNWVWTEVQIAGFPPDQSYGEFFQPTDDGGYFVSHYPTWQFSWSPKTEIDALRSRIPKITFDQELGALFITDSARVFRNVEECFSRELPLKILPHTLLMGLDLARFQDWTALVIMTPGGRVLHIDRWNDTEWSIQRPRIARIAREWGNALVVVDRANIGSVIEEDLRNAGVEVMAVDLNAPSVKSDLIEALMLAFETTAISIPDPKSDWAPDEALQLYKELCWYEFSRTATGRLSFSAPKGLTDDVLMALGLANWGRVRGGISFMESEGVAFSPDEFESLLDEDEEEEHNEGLDWDEDEGEPPKAKGKRKREKELKLPSIRPAIFKGVFGRHRSALGYHSPTRSIWDGHA